MRKQIATLLLAAPLCLGLAHAQSREPAPGAPVAAPSTSAAPVAVRAFKRDCVQAKEQIKAGARQTWSGVRSSTRQAWGEVRIGTRHAWNEIGSEAHQAREKVKSIFTSEPPRNAAPVTEHGAPLRRTT